MSEQKENTQNKDEKIMNLDALIRDLEVITTVKKGAFLSLIEELRQFPNEQSYIKLKNLLESLQPVLCTVASKVALFEEDFVATNNPDMPMLGAIKNEALNELQESTKLQIEQIDQKGIRCKYETYNRELAKQISVINRSVDKCIGYLVQKFETYPSQKGNLQANNPANN